MRDYEYEDFDSESAADSSGTKPSVRQVHSDTRFPQRKNPRQEYSLPVMEPTSADKLIAGIWRQLHSPVKLSRLPSVWHLTESTMFQTLRKTDHTIKHGYPHWC